MFFKPYLFFLLLIPLAIWSQPNYTILSNNNPHPDNLFFHVGGPPSKPVNVLDGSDGYIIYTEDMGLKGWAWKVNATTTKSRILTGNRKAGLLWTRLKTLQTPFIVKMGTKQTTMISWR